MPIMEQLSYSSKLRSWNTYLKIFLAFSTLSLNLMYSNSKPLFGLLVFISLSFFTTRLGKIPQTMYLRIVFPILGFMLLTCLPVLFQTSHRPFDILSLTLNKKIYFGISYPSLSHGISLIASCLGGISCLLFLSFSTPMIDLLSALKKLHFPDIFLELMLLIYRFLSLLLEIAMAIHLSQISRLGNHNYRSSLKNLGYLFTNLFMKAFQRSSKLYDAMEVRGYSGKIPILSLPHPLQKKHLIIVIVYEITLLFLCIAPLPF